MTDLSSREDIKVLVDSFYGKVIQDPLLGPIFSKLDLLNHLPIMYNFWSSILLGDQSYQGNPFQKHMALAIDTAHFEQWLSLFNETVDEYFQGSIAEEAKSRALTIANLFQVRLGLV